MSKPSTYSIVMKSRPFSRPKSKTVTMFACVSRAASFASWMSISAKRAFSENSGRISLTTKSRAVPRSFVTRARNSSAMPPLPTKSKSV